MSRPCLTSEKVLSSTRRSNACGWRASVRWGSYAIVALGLSACGSSGAGTTSGSEPSTSSTTPADPSGATAAPSSGAHGANPPGGPQPTPVGPGAVPPSVPPNVPTSVPEAPDPSTSTTDSTAHGNADTSSHGGTSTEPLDTTPDGTSAEPPTDTTTGPGDGACDPGHTSTEWARQCPTEPVTCTAGEWVAGGPDPDHTNFTLKGQSAHFAIYSDEDLDAGRVQGALDTLETTIWQSFFGAPVYFKQPLCDRATKYKAAIHVHSDWGLTGGAWAPDRMGMWIGSAALSDHWGLAHEFTHALQSVSGGQSCSRENTCGWVYESHANFMAHQLEEYRGDVHCSEMLVNAPHLYLGSTRDRYCNWQFMEFLKDKHCYRAVNEIWSGPPTPDPFSGIMQSMGWSVAQLNDFIGEWAMHNVTWDYVDPPPTARASQGPTYRRAYGSIVDRSQATRRLRTTRVLPLEGALGQRRFYSPDYWAPQRFGYNVVRLLPESGATEVTIKFRGVPHASGKAGFRWGLVAADATLSVPRYSVLQKGIDGELTFCVTGGEELFLVVAATPTELETIVWDQAYSTIPRYPYLFEVSGAWPEGFRDGAPDDCPNGLTRAANGGGCAPAGTTAYVGPYATVLAGASATGDARIEEHAVVVRGTVSGGKVGALTLVGNGNAAFDITAGEARTTFYPLGYFEGNQGLAGGTLIGDVEYRGNGLRRTSGTCSGFVDQATCLAPGVEATPLPPYSWR